MEIEGNLLIVAVDIGGTQIRVAILNENFEILGRESGPTGFDSDPLIVCMQMMHMIRSVKGKSEWGRVLGVGISAPTVDRRTGRFVNPPNLPRWHDFSISDFINDELDLPVSVSNDASLAALGESRFGAGVGVNDMLYYTLSTGVGGGIIVDGKLYEGQTGFAGELGHITVNPNGPICNCGNRGCLETYASGPAIAQAGSRAVEMGKNTCLSREGTISTEDVFGAALSGDQVCKEIVQNAGKYLAIGITGAMHMFEPERIVIGGGVSAGFGQMRPHIDRYISQHAMAHFYGKMDIRLSELGDDSALIGAACHLKDNYFAERT